MRTTGKLPKLWMATIAMGSMLIASGVSGATTPKISGTLVGTFITSAFSSDGSAPADLITYVGTDNIGQSVLMSQAVLEYSTTSSGPCRAFDGTTGNLYSLISGYAASNYTAGQLYLSATPGSSICVNASQTGFGGSLTFTTTGGTKNFTAATGTITMNIAGTYLALPTSPGSGAFGAVQLLETGGTFVK